MVLATAADCLAIDILCWPAGFDAGHVVAFSRGVAGGTYPKSKGIANTRIGIVFTFPIA